MSEPALPPAPPAAPPPLAGPPSAATTPAPVAPGGETKPAVAEKPAEPKAAEPTKFPDGLAAADIDALKAVAKELGLDEGKAPLLAKMQASQKAEAEKATAAAQAKLSAEWDAAVKADPDIGGLNLDRNLTLANRALEKFGGKELAAFLRSAGLSNHPGLLKAFVNVGRAMAEDSVAGSSTPATPAADLDPVSTLAAAYTSMHKKE